MSRHRPTIALASNSAWNLAHFRAPLLDEFRRVGAKIIAIVPDGDDMAALSDLGVEVEVVPLERSGTSPVRDLRLLSAYRNLLSNRRPDVFLGFTAKPNIYGSMAAASLRIPLINNISGLGSAFLSGGPLAWLLRQLYRWSLKPSKVVFFQNDDDRRLFVDEAIVSPRQARLLTGSGIDLDRFAAHPMPESGDNVRFLLVARMLRDKGVLEFVEAARILRGEGARFTLLGPAGDDNQSAIDEATLRGWQAEGIVDWVGATDDVRGAMAAHHVIVLPSYREGMPRTLLEAAAIGRPVVTTDAPGCRQAVVAEVTGLMCPPRDAPALAEAMRLMIALGPRRRAEMGLANRHRAELEFGHDSVVGAYREALAACGVALPA